MITLASALLGACEALLPPFGTRSAQFAAIPSTWRSKMGRLKCQSPVPSDIDIAQACSPVHIDKVAKDLGLCPKDYDLHGSTKAKVCRAAPPDPTTACGAPAQRARDPVMTRDQTSGDQTSPAGRRSSSPYWIKCRGSPTACMVSAACTGTASTHDPIAPRAAWQRQDAPRCSRPDRPMRDAMGRSGGGGYQPDAPGRGQEHHHRGPEPGAGCPPGALRGHLHPPALSGVRCCRWCRPPSRVSVQCPFQGVLRSPLKGVHRRGNLSGFRLPAQALFWHSCEQPQGGFARRRSPDHWRRCVLAGPLSASRAAPLGAATPRCGHCCHRGPVPAHMARVAASTSHIAGPPCSSPTTWSSAIIKPSSDVYRAGAEVVVPQAGCPVHRSVGTLCMVHRFSTPLTGVSMPA